MGFLLDAAAPSSAVILWIWLQSLYKCYGLDDEEKKKGMNQSSNAGPLQV